MIGRLQNQLASGHDFQCAGLGSVAEQIDRVPLRNQGVGSSQRMTR